MELRQLRSFVAAAEELNFTRAAARCHLAQPSLTRQIQKLEEELGTRLFDRSRKQVRLTAAGQIFFEEIRGAIAALERGVGRVRPGGTGAGRLRVAAPIFAMYGRVPRLLDAFALASPEVPLELHELYSVDALEGLQKGWLDAAFLRADTTPAELHTCPVERIPILLYLPALHPLAARTAVRFGDLADEPFILLGGHTAQNVSQAYRALVEGWCRRAGFEPRMAPVENWVQSDSAIVRLVASGQGVHLALPSPVSQSLPSEVVSRPLTDPEPYLELVLAWKGRESRPLDRFLTFAEAGLAADDS